MSCKAFIDSSLFKLCLLQLESFLKHQEKKNLDNDFLVFLLISLKCNKIPVQCNYNDILWKG